MKKAALIVGARPQFIKTAPLILELGRFYQVVLIHSGQHHDFDMSDIFFEELRLPRTDYHLRVSASTDGKQVGRMMEGLESVLRFEKPDFAIVVGDTNSTMAGALASVKLRIPLAHVEAGVRSKDEKLPEQINRVVTDSVTDCFLCPTPTAVRNLNNEGKSANVFDTGDIIYDSLRAFEKNIPDKPSMGFDIPAEFVLVTLHRAEAVDDRENLLAVLRSLSTSPYPVIFPMHPRTRKMLLRFGLYDSLPTNMTVVDPVGYLELLALLKECQFAVSDSGGIQREGFYFEKRTIVPRPETEWVELEQSGWVLVAGYDFEITKLLDKSVSERSGELTRPASADMADRLRRLF